MIQCPHCETGFLWGIYLDIPPEMKAGKAQWLGCEAPEPETSVTCPKCQQTAGTYQKLFASDGDSRRVQKAQQKEAHFNRIQARELGPLLLLGQQFLGNYERSTFLETAWKTFSSALENLKSERLLPKKFFELTDGAARAVGLRYHDPKETKAAELEYFAAVVLSDQFDGAQAALEKIAAHMRNPDLENVSKLKIVTLPQDLFAVYDFSGEAADFLDLHGVMSKDWLSSEERAYEAAPHLPAVEVYFSVPEVWPPEASHHFQARYALPIAPRVVFQADDEDAEF